MNNSFESPMDGRFENRPWFRAESHNFVGNLEQADYVEILKQAGGVDPVLAVAEGRKGEIPSAGWLIHAVISAGYRGTVDFYRYSESGFVIEDIYRSPLTTFLDCKVHTSGEWMLAYENPKLAAAGEFTGWKIAEAFFASCPVVGSDDRYLDSGGRLLHSANLRAESQASFTQHNLKRYLRGYLSGEYFMPVNRVVSGPEELGAVIVSLGAGMGLGEKDIQTLVTVAGKQISSSS